MSISSLNRDFYYYTEPIGYGSFSNVYKGFHFYNKNEVAIKKITKIIDKEYFDNEIKVMKQLTHENVLKLHKVIKYKLHTYLILDYCESNLYTYIESGNNKFNNKYFIEVVSGLEYLYTSKILHRDIKPQNILIKNNIIKISDFGFAKSFEKNQLITTFCGSPLYMAPEIIKHREYNNNSDIWSLGVLLYELISKIHPYTMRTRRELWKLINDDSIVIDYSFIENKKIREFLKNMLVIDPKQRISWEDLFNTFKNLNLNVNYSIINNIEKVGNYENHEDDISHIRNQEHIYDSVYSNNTKVRSSSISIIDNKQEKKHNISYSAPNNLKNSYMEDYIKQTVTESPNNDINIIGISPYNTNSISSYLEKPYELFKSFFKK